MRRRPRWQEQGNEPDYRFSLANERTFLAWMRTCLALLAGAVAVAFVPQFRVDHARWVLGIGLALLGAAAAAYAYVRWAANERAMRNDLPLSSGYGALAMAVVVVAVGVTVFAFALAQAV